MKSLISGVRVLVTESPLTATTTTMIIFLIRIIKIQDLGLIESSIRLNLGSLTIGGRKELSFGIRWWVSKLDFNLCWSLFFDQFMRQVFICINFFINSLIVLQQSTPYFIIVIFSSKNARIEASKVLQPQPSSGPVHHLQTYDSKTCFHQTGILSGVFDNRYSCIQKLYLRPQSSPPGAKAHHWA